jgi:hypothetical protein
MKQITCINTDAVLVEYLKEYYVPTYSEELSEHIFIDWWPPDSQGIEQITVLEDAIKKKCKIAVFDRYLSLKHHEVDWLLRYKNVTLFEPCLLTRPGFTYLPFWYLYDDREEQESLYDIGIVKDSNRKNVIYDDGWYVTNSYKDINMTILCGSKDEFNRGYLPDMNEMFRNDCLPLLPIQHKYYSSLFWGLTIKNSSDMEFYINAIKLRSAMIFGIHESIRKLFPEMLIENVVRKINQYLRS